MTNPNDLHAAADKKQVILELLRDNNPETTEKLFTVADRVRSASVGDVVHLRGLIEFSNLCHRKCAYCGLRAGNWNVTRYSMSKQEILDCVTLAHSFGYGTVVLQSGENPNMKAEWLGEIVRTIKKKYPVAVTLSVGEQPLENYRLWKEKGADRYLLKFETSDPELYRRIHPPIKQNEPSRVELLTALRELGYEIGGGIMIGMPGQTYSSLADDILLFADLGLDMVGVGPYIPHPDTPLGREFLKNNAPVQDQVPNTDLMALKALALTRIMCPKANIPSTTALAAISEKGFESGLKAGANVIMPNVTSYQYRKLYQVYPKAIRQSRRNIWEQVIETILEAGRQPCLGIDFLLIKVRRPKTWCTDRYMNNFGE